MSVTGREPTGLRERKKAATRKAIADTALRLFLTHGYEQVSMRQIAETADVSVSTLFNYFPGGKEALVFDDETHNEAALIAAVTDRPPGRTIPEALRIHLTGFVTDPQTPGSGLAEFQAFVQRTPALREYARAMWLRHEEALARAIAAQTGRPADDLTSAALACFALEIVTLARSRPDPAAAVARACELLDRGWAAVTA
ncbi:TetR family transcriptional regulator [Actinoplanes sp. NBRC 14428]|uniref:TetR family transcriptional regulator n=1 Tax=Pseudosporangium ferrugineum TaxID=439699 RepID=A0A2T0RUM8_9ACTN|nr:TetR/AcrR family transcriptional regulator [Pseudosporangium ferrugineum]PRY24763.1 TetR family transcriptional regulator [Pseudosporangium ferrugineum]BCJ55016.1 TetR family transcriptional regulator [Actinoplanes sp. NBRC 14428]